MTTRSRLNQCLSFFGSLSEQLISNCRSKAEDGTILYTPDGIASYNALWGRDFHYMVEYAGEFISNEDVEGCIAYLINGTRADGWIPDRVYGSGLAVYAAGVPEAPIGKANLDTAPFLVMTVYEYLKRLEPALACERLGRWYPILHQAMDIMPLGDHGLVYNDPQSPHSPYGFTDTVCKTGELFYESVLYWRACRYFSEMLKNHGGTDELERIYSGRALAIEENISELWDSKIGAFVAATQECRQLDIWGIAYAIYVGFPLGSHTEEMIDLFVNQFDDFVWKGQVKHLPGKESWERLLISIKPGEYQNGAYWATATGWVMWVVAQRDEALALEMAESLIEYINTEGVFECCNIAYTKLPSFVVSAANPFGALKRLQKIIH